MASRRRTGTEEDFIRIRDAAYMPERVEDFEGLQGAGLRNVAVQFFTHHAGGDQPGYGFVHKSFGEYLCARALIAAGEKWLRRYDGLVGDFAKAWLQLASQQAVTPEILRFMIDEARLRVKRSNADVPDLDAARRNVESLVKIASATLRDGFPAHVPLEAMQAPSKWRGRERLQRHAEESLYAAIHSWAEVAYPPSLLNAGEQFGWKPGPISVNWANGLIARRLHGRLGGWPASGIGYRLLNRWNFSGQQLSGVQLIEAGLQGADLSRASLHLACRYKADLRGADLSGADLTRVNLQQADLEGANLRSAVLKEANLNGANLQGASLEQADMLSAILKGTLLKGADLSKATNLSQNQIDAAQGNLSTKLPANLTQSTHWESESGSGMAKS